MAKLSQLTDWISQAINDAPRARSMMLVSRKRGIFTTGGRGGGAPDMTPRDAANATLLALFDGPTVKSADCLIELGNLPLATVQICPNGPREPERITFNDKFAERDAPLPGHFKDLPQNALKALTWIFSHHSLPYHLCQVSILKSTITILEIAIMDLDVDMETDLESERDILNVRSGFPIWQFQRKLACIP